MKDNKTVIMQVMPEFGLAGAEIMCENLTIELDKNPNYSVIVVSLFDYHSPITDRLESNGVQIFYLSKKSGLDISVIFKLKNLMISEGVDIIHTHRYTMQYAIPAAKLAGIKKCVHTVHNIASKEVSRIRRTFASFVYKTKTSIPISISPQVTESISKEYHINTSDIKMVFNGIDLNKCLVKKDYTTNNKFQIVHIGRFSEQKNHETIIKAVKKLKDKGFDIILNLIGDGPLFKDIKIKVTNLGLKENIIFHGLKSDVYPYLRQSDCFILPSFYEGMPISLIEAMGCGLPIIASNVGGIPDMIKDEYSGLIIEPNSDDLVEAIKRIIVDQNLREKLGTNALHDSYRFSIEEMIKQYTDIYNML